MVVQCTVNAVLFESLSPGIIAVEQRIIESAGKWHQEILSDGEK